MRIWSVFKKTVREITRDWVGLSLSLLTAPFFVLLYWLFFPAGSTTYAVMALNQDTGPGTELAASLLESLQAVTYSDGLPILNITQVEDRAAAEKRLQDRAATLLVIIPQGFSETLQSHTHGDGPPASVTFVGDLTNPYYAIAAVMANAGLEAFMQEQGEAPRPVQIEEIPLGASGARTEFEIYVPGLLVFAVIMLVFQVAMLLASEVEAGTLRRLRITRMSAFELLSGVSLAVILLGLVSVVLAYLTAVALGLHSQGPAWVALLVAVLACFTIIGAGLMVAALSKSMSQAFLIANFPLILFMFFSGAIFPIHGIKLFELGGRAIGLYDLLPPSHAVVAVNKVLTLGAGLGDVLFELGAMLALSVVYYALGVWLFHRRHFRLE